MENKDFKRLEDIARTFPDRAFEVLRVPIGYMGVMEDWLWIARWSEKYILTDSGRLVDAAVGDEHRGVRLDDALRQLAHEPLSTAREELERSEKALADARDRHQRARRALGLED